MTMPNSFPLPPFTAHQPPFLPTTEREQSTLEIDQFDIILVSGDAYVDHPSFGTALLGRVLTGAGYSVGVIPQPDISDQDSFLTLGLPRLFFSVSSGCVDSMVNHYTPSKKRRSDDAYSPGGTCLRPDRAVLVYTDLLHRIVPHVPIVIGGVEASLRRFTHYDYWSDKVRQSILADAPADLLVFGMGERPLLEIASILSEEQKGDNKTRLPELLYNVPGTVVKRSVKEFKAFLSEKIGSFFDEDSIVILPSFSEVSSDRYLFMQAEHLIITHQNPTQNIRLVQSHPKTVIVQNPPAFPLSTSELDSVYGLPYKRLPHPSYTEPIPAFETVKDSITSHRGCYGNCSFCAISLHQGRIVRSRSMESILDEVRTLTDQPHFSKTIRDIGGPTANMYGSWCERWKTHGACMDKNCIGCRSLHLSQNRYLNLLNQAAHIPSVKHVFIGSGLRHDLIMMEDVLEQFLPYISGQMKIAPEHISDSVLRHMNKPSSSVFKDFIIEFDSIQKKHYGKSSKRQYIIPYLMSGHPGCTVFDMVELVEFLHGKSMYTEQVQDFTPTPMTVSTAMYYTGLCMDGTDIHIPAGEEKQIQRALLGYKDPHNRKRVLRGLKMAQRLDLLRVLGISH